jgi:lysophospholipase L1-like esterase
VRRTAIARVAALLLGVVLGLAGAELMVRLAVPANQFWWVAPVYRAVDTPELHYTLDAGLAETVYGVDLKTNSLGFRGPEWQTPKLPGRFRIALFGDSHAFGLGVAFADTAGEVAARTLRHCSSRDVEVLNFAINGFNSVQELAVLRTYPWVFEPDVIVLQVSGNDHDPAAYADSYGYLVGPPPPDDGADPFHRAVRRTLHRILLRSRLYLWGRRLFAWRKQGSQTTPVPDGSAAADPSWMAAIDDLPPSTELDDAVGRPVRAMIAEAKARGTPVVLMSYASPPDYRRLLRNISHEEGLPWLELLKLLPEAHSYPEVLARFSLGWDPHLNAVAHARWGRALARVIRERGYLPGTGETVAGCEE